MLIQSIWTWLAFAHGATGVRQAPDRSTTAEHTAAPAADPEWSPPEGPSLRRREPARPPHRIGGRWVQIAYAITDVVLVCLNGALGLWFRFFPTSPWNAFLSGHAASSGGFPLPHYDAFLLLYAALIVLFCQGQDLYRTPRMRSVADESFRVIKAVSLATLLLAAFLFLSGDKIVSRLVLVYAAFLNVVALSAWRLTKRQIIIRRASRGIGTRNALIIGAGKIGQALARHLEQNKMLGYTFKGFLDGNHNTDPRMLGRVEDLQRVALAEFVDEIFITIPSERELVKRVVLEARGEGLDVKVVPDLFDGLGWHAPLNYLGDFPLMELHWEPIPAFGLFIKRMMDFFIALISLIVLTPLLGLVALLIKLDSSGPVLYRSRRVGKKGRPFVCYKFRTMVSNADEIKDQFRHLNEREGPFFKITNDPRLTRVGKVMRKYSIDELPQLWNVLKGDMSLVGPRPHPVDDYKQYSVEHLRRLDVKPGMTGLWQVTARQDPSFETNMALDLQYIENWNLWFDIRILLRTIPEALRGRGR